MGSFPETTTQQSPMRLHSTKPHLYLRIVHRVYRKSLRNINVSKVPDYRFKTGSMTLKRLEHDVPASDIFKRALVGVAFESIDLRIFK